MVETTQQYKQRVLSYVVGQSPLAALAAAPRKIEKLVAKASPSQLRRRPAPEKWSVAEILAHLADGELVIGYRIRLIAAQPGSSIQGYDQDAWAAAMEYGKRPVKRSLAAFRAQRDINLALLKSLRPEQWKRHGVHSERGPETIEVVVALAAGHDINHLRQIEAILKGRPSA